jgi:hypothetical protein
MKLPKMQMRAGGREAWLNQGQDGAIGVGLQRGQMVCAGPWPGSRLRFSRYPQQRRSRPACTALA